ncbi:MAG: YolD-like family protein [Christensenellaceae bacterium]|jgi:hypothetical protein|nr:YolD-like family protein [Christensenellaceae bacterium]
MSRKYDDIINLPHHVSSTRQHMPVSDRAAQFSPFAALTGHDAAVKETGRITEQKTELSEDAKAYLNEQLNMIQIRIDEMPVVSITYFVPDKKKAGGEYVPVTGTVKTIDEFERTVVMWDKTRIPIDDILEIIFTSTVEEVEK